MKYVLPLISFLGALAYFFAIRKRLWRLYSSSDDAVWPPLSEYSFVSGRLADLADISAGQAAFTLQKAGGSVAEPIPVTIPQFAIHRQCDSNSPQACVVIQAEQRDNVRIIGAVSLRDRTHIVGTYEEFDLLGTTPPS